MRHGAERRDGEVTVTDGAGGAAAAADEGRARAVDRAVRPLSAAGTELHHSTALRSADDPVRLCRDQALVVDGQKQHGFNELRLDDRPAHRDDRLARKNRGALRDCPDIAAEFEIGKIGEKLLVEDSG